MRKLFFLMLLFPLFALSQYSDQRKSTSTPPDKPADKPAKSTKSKLGIGLKAGVNFANVAGVSSINGNNKTGFMVGAFITPGGSDKVISKRIEVSYSKQGYDYKTNTKTGTVDLDYIMLHKMMALNVGKFAQVQLGLQTAFLLNAKADSSSSQPGTDPYNSPYGNPYGAMTQYYNRVNLGGAAGLEIYPFKGILIGARYNISFGDMFKNLSSPQMGAPSFLPKINAKNNVVQFFIGYRF